MKKSIDRIVEASNYPLSIVIIEVGNTNFADMVGRCLSHYFNSTSLPK